MYRVEIPITLHVKGPFVTQSTVPGPYGFDVAAARNADGRPYIPGTLLTGKLRQAWEELRDVAAGSVPYKVPDGDTMAELFGQGSDEAKGEFAPFPKGLFFSDLVLQGPEPGSAERYRIQIDEERGAVKKGAIAIIESPFLPTHTAGFSGKATFLSPDKEKAERIRKLIETGLCWVDQVGAFSSVGFGHVKEIKTGKCAFSAIDPGKSPGFDLSDGLDMAILPEGPFCIAMRHTRENNLFVSKEIIPGNVIKGAVARMLGQLSDPQGPGPFKELLDNLSGLRFLHAFPSRNCFERPVTLPLSLVKVGERLYDVALQKAPCLIHGKAPAFQVDWKDCSRELSEFGWPELERELRVRTAIDPETVRSEEERLFAYEMVVPGGCVWVSRVDASAIKDPKTREKALCQLAALLSAGLLGIGKTKATAETKLFKKGTITDKIAKDRLNNEDFPESRLVITLLTPALLLSPTGLLDNGKALDETSGHAELFAAYKSAWKNLCGHLVLEHFYAGQELSGGPYQYHRFMDKNSPYYPWMLTRKGSVFVFSIKNGIKNGIKQVKDVLERWLAEGLPIPGPVRDFYKIPDKPEEAWKKCPFVPQNGFGEIAVNMDLHLHLKPPRNTITPIEDPFLQRDKEVAQNG